jgi:hypothetical protein
MEKVSARLVSYLASHMTVTPGRGILRRGVVTLFRDPQSGQRAAGDVAWSIASGAGV